MKHAALVGGVSRYPKTRLAAALPRGALASRRLLGGRLLTTGALASRRLLLRGRLLPCGGLAPAARLWGVHLHATHRRRRRGRRAGWLRRWPDRSRLFL